MPTLSGRHVRMSMRSAEARLARKTLTGEVLTCVWRATEARISALPTTPSTKVREYTAKEGPWTQNRLQWSSAVISGGHAVWFMREQRKFLYCPTLE